MKVRSQIGLDEIERVSTLARSNEGWSIFVMSLCGALHTGSHAGLCSRRNRARARSAVGLLEGAYLGGSHRFLRETESRPGNTSAAFVVSEILISEAWRERVLTDINIR